MILRKPYALLIKYFRLIHIILTGLLIYLIVRSNLLINFFNEFIQSGYVVNEFNFAGSYINFFMYLTVILILGICITVYFLMKTKEKPTRLYVFTIIYYIFILIMFSVMHNALTIFEIDLVEATTARAYRDIAVLVAVPQYIFTVFFAIRAVGFDLKKFNFNKDLQELKIEAQDSEEFEIAVDRDNYKLKRSLRRTIRELRYYVLENKFILTCIAIVLITIVFTVIYLNNVVYNRQYQVDQSFISNNMKIKFTNSYITNLSYNGTKLSNDKYYLVVNVNLNNLLSTKNSLKLENYRLIMDNKIKVPITTRNEHFVDLGIPYNKEKFKPNSENENLLIYELNESELSNQYKIRVINTINAHAGEIRSRYSETVLKPTYLNNVELLKEVKLNEEIEFENELISNSNALIKDYQITNYYKFNYNFCINKICNNSTGFVSPDIREYNNTLLVLDGNISFADSILLKRVKSHKNMYSMFVKITYTKNNEKKAVSVKDVTPDNLKDKIIFQTYNGIENADNINLEFTFRNNKYIIKLK